MKSILRNILLQCNIPLTTNLYNDILLKKIIKQIVTPSDNAIDVGCHKGEILEWFLKYAPYGKHFAVEPIPYFYERLKKKFPTVTCFPVAASNEYGQKEFFWIKDKPAYSGLSKRAFTEKNADIVPLRVEVKPLDHLIPLQVPIKFIKIDVEGAELKVLQGASGIIKNHRPYIAFEFGVGGSDYYNTTAADIFLFFAEKNYMLFDFQSFLNKNKPYTLPQFKETYQKNTLYNFIAVPAA